MFNNTVNQELAYSQLLRHKWDYIRNKNTLIYSNEWESLAQEKIEFVKSLFPPGIIKEGFHVGSTSIPGILARPSVVIYFDVDLLYIKEHLDILHMHGINTNYTKENEPGSDSQTVYAEMVPNEIERNRGCLIFDLWFVKNLQLFSSFILRRDFRDYLRDNPKEAKEYELFKIKCMDDFNAAYDRGVRGSELQKIYSCQKRSFVISILRKCGHENIYLSPCTHEYGGPVPCILGSASVKLKFLYALILTHKPQEYLS